MRPNHAPTAAPDLEAVASVLSGHEWASLLWVSWALEDEGVSLAPAEVATLARSDRGRRYEVDGDRVRLRPVGAPRSSGPARPSRPVPRRLYVGLVGPDAEMALIAGARRGGAAHVLLSETVNAARGLALRRGLPVAVFEVDGTRLSYHTDVERCPDGGWAVDYVPPRLLAAVSTEPLAAATD